MTSLDELVGAREEEPGRWSCHIGRELHGAFGGAFGGMLAALAVHVARATTPTRTPTGVDCHFVRGLAAGDATITTAVVREGRSLSLVDVAIADEAGRTATKAHVTLVDPAALHPVDATTDLQAVTGEGRAWRAPAGTEIPIIATLEPRTIPCGDGATAVALRIPWHDAAGSLAAEAACLAADLAVGPPVAEACGDRWVPHPNPDISLRFTSVHGAGEEVVGIGRLAGVDAGLAAVTVDVRRGDGRRLAVGVATSVLLAPREEHR